MDAQGNILTQEQVDALDERERKALGLVPIPTKELESVKQMTRKERRAWRRTQLKKRLREARATQRARGRS